MIYNPNIKREGCRGGSLRLPPRTGRRNEVPAGLGRLCGPVRQEWNVGRHERYDLSFRRTGSQPPTTTPQRTGERNPLPIADARWFYRKGCKHEQNANR